MREELDRRPLVAVFLGLVAGCAGAVVGWFALFAVPLVLLVKRWPVRLASVLACGIGLLTYPRLAEAPVVEEAFLEAEVDVLTMPVTTADSMRTVVGHKDERYVLYLGADSGVVLGDRLRVRADIKPLSEGQVARRGAIGTMRAISEPEVVDRGSFVWRVGMALRRSFQRMTDRFADPAAGPLLDGMCFSMTSDVPLDLRRAMARTGTSHIVSTSGLHIVLVAFALAGLLGTMPVPRPAQIAVLFALLAVYAAAAGFQPPVMRAILMTLVLVSAYLFRRGPDGLSALAFAGIVSLLWAPELVRDIGFQLSMVAVGSLVLFSRLPEATPLDSHAGLREWALQYTQASLVVTLATAPLLAYHFGMVPLMSVPANLLVVPVLGIVISGALAAWGLWAIVPAVGVGMLKLCVEPMTGWVGLVIERLGSLPFAALDAPEFSAYWLVPIYLLALLLWRPHVRPA